MDGNYGHHQGAADSYYAGSPQGGYPPNHQQHHDGDGPDGERGVMGALAGGAAGAYGGHQIGGKYAGHSKTGTVIGAVAGAIAGHKLQETVSDWRDDRKEEHRHENEHRNDYHHNDHHEHHEHHDRSIGGGGNYSQSSRDAFVEQHGDFNLIAECRGRDGGFHRSVIPLNRYLSNEGGNFRWFSGGGGGGGATMTIQPGDTLGSVAARFNCNFDELARMNNIQNPDLIYPGQVLHIPGGGGGGAGGNFGGSARNVRVVDNGRLLEAELRRPDGSWANSCINLDERIGNDNGSLRFI